MLEVSPKLKHLGQPLFREIGGKASTPAAARKVRCSTWEKLLRRYGVTRISADRVVALFREEALTVAPGATAAAVETIRTALALLEVVNAEIARAEKQMTQFLDALSETEAVGGGAGATAPDLVTILRSRKGLGDKALARLFAWGFEAVCAGDYGRLRVASGAGPPVRVQSGERDTARMRRAVPYSLAAGRLPPGTRGVSLGRGREGIQPEAEGRGEDDGPAASRHRRPAVPGVMRDGATPHLLRPELRRQEPKIRRLT